ncbi:cytochrome P450 [Stereum hirsutum FP-91666 SS1]|uniref:cytochrome P450 n=1 Tax=Stereum hirsutum (strain FP-91666) TaxID=721885 RepID=UPI000440F8B3|nr:cytochrome P450 [Stereum hirsutum FP-91666 SS1]EIM88971.1 cytochrome P450 [Stereum hirsutum FP-91666 SS1]
MGNHPGSRQLVSNASVLGQILPRIRGISGGRHAIWREKHTIFQEAGWDGLANVSIIPRLRTQIWLSDAAAIKEVTMSRARFPKPVHQYRVLLLFGGNIVASEGDEWKRYRKVAAPAFSEKNNKLVWDETVKIMVDMFHTLWNDAPEVTVDHCIEITLPIALFVIGVAGFGRKVSWKDDTVVPPGYTMSFKEALHVVSTGTIVKAIVPNWAMGLTKHFRHVRDAFKELDNYMFDMIRARRESEKKEERYDLFSQLLDASQVETEDGMPQITDRELVGNIFIFLLAGHETTAHTLCFTFAMLALYPEEQDKLYKEIKSLMPDPTRLPTYDEMNSFQYSMAVFYETLRMFPPVNGIPKQSAEDTSIVVGNGSGDSVAIPCPKGTYITIDTPGLHYNPRYWSDPHSFKPERFLGDWPRDAFVPFSAGPRACIGRRFFETEGIAILIMLISRYKVTVKEEPQFANETFEERKARVLAAKPVLTLSPTRVPLTFTKRE